MVALARCRGRVFLAVVLAGCWFGQIHPHALALEHVRDIVRLQGTSYYDEIAAAQQKRLQYSFSQVVDSASNPLFGTIDNCSDKFGSTAKASSIQWSAHFCWASDYWAQGITGTEEGRWRSEVGYRNLLITSWYGKEDSNGRHPLSRLSLVDLDREVFRHLNLAWADANGDLHGLATHAGGLAWAGEYLYVASTDLIWVFNLNHILREGDDVYLVAGERWDIVDTDGDVDSYQISTLSTRWNGATAELIAAHYGGDGAHIFHWALNANERFVANDAWLAESTEHLRVDTVGSVQGIEMHGNQYLLNSSNVTFSENQQDGLFRLTNDNASESSRIAWQMPRWNGQDLYIDDARGVIWSLTEGPATEWELERMGNRPHSSYTTFVYSYSVAGVIDL